MCQDADDIETLSIDGLGDVPSPSAARDHRDGRKQVSDVSVPDQCPVTGCYAHGFDNFAELRGHFGKQADGAHSSFDLSIDDYTP